MKNKILVIEDDRAISELLCMNLTIAGYETVATYDGIEAQRLLLWNEDADLAVVDIMLPGKDGFALMEDFRAKNLPVIYLTAKDDVASKVKGLKLGAEDYMVKPFEMLELLVRIEKILERTGRAKGAVIEARLDKGRGPVATLLVQNGTLHTGDVILAGTSVGKVRVMTNDKGTVVHEAGPSVPVEITGLAEVPAAGDVFDVVEDERLAKTLVEQRKHEAKQAKFSEYQKVTLDNLFSQIAEGEMKELAIIVKADVQGSVEAVKQSLEKIQNDEVRVRVIHGGVGAINESDVMLADASNAIIIGFNVRPDPLAEETAARDHVEIRTYRVIYDAIEDVETAMKGMLAPKFREVVMGRIEVRQVYKISSVGAVAGAYVLSGKVTRQCQIRVVRDGIVIAEDKMSSLKRFKDDVKEVTEGYECGITLEKFRDFKEGDIFEAFIMEEYQD